MMQPSPAGRCFNKNWEKVDGISSSLTRPKDQAANSPSGADGIHVGARGFGRMGKRAGMSRANAAAVPRLPKRLDNLFAVRRIADNFTSRPDILDVGKFGIPWPSFNCRMPCASQAALRD
jgi:hypothetical protein